MALVVSALVASAYVDINYFMMLLVTKVSLIFSYYRPLST